MLLIVAHHYVVNSGLISVLKESDDIVNSSVMLLFGAWGKTGINCFLLITGYFMCKSNFTLRKLLKLYLQIAFYGLIIYCIFCFSGHENFSPFKLFWSIWPIKSISVGFTSCFLIFYLFIPILNVLVKAMNQRLHKYLVVVLITIFSILPTFPRISMTHNYVTWFMALYFIAAYIRIYGIFPNISHKQWGLLAILSVIVGSLSVLFLSNSFHNGNIGFFKPYLFLEDSNKIIPLLIAISTFMYFKDLRLPYSKFINLIGASTFGVLLIHANSDTMLQWLWQETIDCVGHYGDSALWTLSYATISCLFIFTICAGVDCFRGRYIEPKFLDVIYNRSKKMFNRLQTSKELVNE